MPNGARVTTDDYIAIILINIKTIHKQRVLWPLKSLRSIGQKMGEYWRTYYLFFLFIF